jgi:DNA-binding NtrC family response regulator
MSVSGPATATILVVEDDPNQFRLYGKVLKGYRLTCVVNATAAIKALEERLPDLIILDHVLAGGERGTDFLPRLKEIAAHVPVIIVSGTLDGPLFLNFIQTLKPGGSGYRRCEQTCLQPAPAHAHLD